MDEWPRGANWRPRDGRLMLNIGISLALVTAVDELSRVLLYCRPVISLSKYFICQRLTIQVISTYAFVHFSEGIVCFGRTKTLEERKGEDRL